MSFAKSGPSLSFLRGAIVLTIAFSGWGCESLQGPPPPAAQEIPPPAEVVARGKIIPQWDVIKLSVPNAEDSRVNRLFVQEGDQVRPNQVIATLQGAERRIADLESARANVELLQARLKRVIQGDAKPGAIAAQQAVVNRLQSQLPAVSKQRQAEVASAQSTLVEAALTYQRQQQLLQSGAISNADLEASRQDFETAQANLTAQQATLEETITSLKVEIQQEQAELAELQQVRPIDITIAEAELKQAQLEVKQRQADFEDTQVRSPVAGQILRVNTKVGEQVNIQLGIVELGRTQQMYVLTEVFETDLAKVRQGQRATMVSEYGGFFGKIQGKVESIGLQIGTPTIAADTTDPTTDENSRVVNVGIRIDPEDSRKVASFTNMQVRVTIALAQENL